MKKIIVVGARASRLILLSSTLLMPFGAMAQDSADIHTPEPTEEIIVTAMSRDKTNLLAGVSVMASETLADARRPSLGDTLASLPGVSSSGFGPGAARPVLRGLGGDRLRILTDGIGAFDASSSSADHAVSINPMTAERIEVVRGPTALLYGSSAIGGVVNVIDNRIPRRVPGEAIHAEADLGYGSAADERSVSSSLTGGLGGGWVAHLDGSFLKTDDVRTGGYLLSKALRDEAAASEDPAIAANAALRGTLPNSAVRTWDIGAGLAWIDDNGSNIGVSVARHESLYGIPNRIATSATGAEAEGDVRIDMGQWRTDLRAEINVDGPVIDKLAVRAGYADYRHAELEAGGGVGTRFFNKGMEVRFDLVQANRGPWHGSSGAQWLTRDFEAVGEEKFLPRSLTETGSIFTLQQFDFGRLRAEIGGRIERTTARAHPDATLGVAAMTQSFTAYSGSAGAAYEVIDDWRLGLNFTHAERAPNAEELYSNGPHAGTLAFEIGDPTLDKEVSNGAEVTLRGRMSGLKVDLSAYYNRYRNFIYQSPTGGIQDDLPIYRIFQGSAIHKGFEVELEQQLGKIGGYDIAADIMADYVRATVRGVGPAPQIPPLRVLGGLAATSPRLDVRAEVEHVRRATRLAPIETATPGFTMVNLTSAWRPWGEDGPLTLRLSAHNLFDVEARRHSSLLKDYAPMTGRDIRVGASVKF